MRKKITTFDEVNAFILQALESLPDDGYPNLYVQILADYLDKSSETLRQLITNDPT